MTLKPTFILSDIVFFIFLYQRYIYKVDMKRVNEFGYSAEMLEDKTKGKLTTNGQPAIEAATDAPKQPADKKDD